MRKATLSSPTKERLKKSSRSTPKVKSVREQDVVAALGQLRELLQSDVGVAAQVLKALVGDVVLEKRQVEGRAEPQMVARFTINAVPALAVLDRGQTADGYDSRASFWGSLHASPNATPARSAGPSEAIVPLIDDRRAAARKARHSRGRAS